MSSEITAAQFHAERMNAQARTQDAERLRAGLREVRRYALGMLGRPFDGRDASRIMNLCDDALKAEAGRSPVRAPAEDHEDNCRDHSCGGCEDAEAGES